MQPLQVKPVVGMLFEHARFLDRNWKPDLSLGETYRDAPHEICRITKIANGLVYYRALDGRGSSYTSLSDFPAAIRKVL